jgi:hypothetical protein
MGWALSKSWSTHPKLLLLCYGHSYHIYTFLTLFVKKTIFDYLNFGLFLLYDYSLDMIIVLSKCLENEGRGLIARYWIFCILSLYRFIVTSFYARF